MALPTDDSTISIVLVLLLQYFHYNKRVTLLNVYCRTKDEFLLDMHGRPGRPAGAAAAGKKTCHPPPPHHHHFRHRNQRQRENMVSA